MKKSNVTSKTLLLRAEDAALPGVACPGPHQRYRHPQLSIEQRPMGPLAHDHLRVEMCFAGVCGTDVHLVQTNERGYVRCSAPADIPSPGRVIGHEGVGRILACGSHVQGFKPGDYVAFESIIVCQQCEACRRGAFNQCHGALLLGMQVDGLFATHADVPASLAHDVTAMAATNETGMVAAACLEPAAVAWVACEKAMVNGGDVVVIFGGGPIGIYCAMICRLLRGAARVYLVEPVPLRRELARQWCDAVYDVEEFFDRDDVRADVIIEASGVLDNVRRVFRKINASGRVALLARSGEPLHIDAIDHMITQAIVIGGSRGHLGGAFKRIIALYRSGRLPLHAVVTDVLESLEDLQELLQNPDRIINEQCKVLVRLR